MVKTRTRLFLTLLLLFGIGLYQLIGWILNDVRPHYLVAMEEAMVDTSTILASLASAQATEAGIPVDDLRTTFDAASKRRFEARIYEMTKTSINMRVYVTDRHGLVLFDSDSGKDEGKDYSQWNDVRRTLNGQYGARASRTDPKDPMTSLLCVAAPITVRGQIAGVLAVCKPTESVRVFLEIARRDVLVVGVVAALVLLLIALITSFWITWPIEKLTRYVRAVRDGQRVPPPHLGRSEIGALGTAFEEMRVALEGKQYVEDYVQTLTHQMKSPLSAVHGAAELLEEDMPPEQRRQFIANIRAESARIQDLVDRMLRLSALENRQHLQNLEEVDLAGLVSSVVVGMRTTLTAKRVTARMASTGAATIACERFLVEQALINLVQNAVDFSNNGGLVRVTVSADPERVDIVVEDEGCGVPDYALDKVFDRFYSLSRPDTGRKSSGLGLAFVRQVAVLHGGKASLENRPEGGAKATLSLARSPGH